MLCRGQGKCREGAPSHRAGRGTEPRSDPQPGVVTPPLGDPEPGGVTPHSCGYTQAWFSSTRWEGTELQVCSTCPLLCRDQQLDVLLLPDAQTSRSRKWKHVVTPSLRRCHRLQAHTQSHVPTFYKFGISVGGGKAPPHGSGGQWWRVVNHAEE